MRTGSRCSSGKGRCDFFRPCFAPARLPWGGPDAPDLALPARSPDGAQRAIFVPEFGRGVIGFLMRDHQRHGRVFRFEVENLPLFFARGVKLQLILCHPAALHENERPEVTRGRSQSGMATLRPRRAMNPSHFRDLGLLRPVASSSAPASSRPQFVGGLAMINDTFPDRGHRRRSANPRKSGFLCPSTHLGKHPYHHRDR